MVRKNESNQQNTGLKATTMFESNGHLYVHIPFCDGKCGYCAFYSVPYAEDKGAGFLQYLEKELESSPRSGITNLSTVYLGGGTPSVMSAEQLKQLMALIKRKCSFKEDLEWTVEGSPNTLTKDKVSLLLDSGVNRVSVGIQTFDDAVLSRISRRHSEREARSIIEHLAGINNLDAGCDLIAGLPGHTRASWRSDLKTICDSGLTHASVYALSLEEGTPFLRKHKEGKLDLPDEDEVADRLAECGEVFSRRGLLRYEVSNYSVIGKECRHNLGYWRGDDYVGIGPGASSRLGLVRYTNRPDIRAYLQSADVARDEEILSGDEDVQERLMYFFRLREGVDLDAYCAEHNVDDELRSDWKQRLKYLCEEGIVAQKGSFYAPTAGGLDFADAICEVFLS